MVTPLGQKTHKSKNTNWMNAQRIVVGVFIVTCGVPQGSILVPQSFNLYMLPTGQIINEINIANHTYSM